MKRSVAKNNRSSLTHSLLFIIFVVFVINIEAYTEPVRGVSKTTIKVGAILDQTGPAAGDITLPVTEAIRNHARYINETTGFLGRKLKFLVEDDRYTIPVGIAAFKKLVFKDKIFALFGPASTGEAKALFRHIEKLKLPNITGAPDEAQVKPFKKYIFMPFNTYEDQLGVICEYIANDLKTKNTKISFVTFDAESGKVAYASIKRWTKFYGFKLDKEILNMGALDAASQVLSIKRKKPTQIIIHHGSPGAVALLRDMRKFGLDIPVFGTMISCMEDTVRMGGNSAKNYIGAHVVGSWYEDFPGLQKMREITLKYKPGTEKPYRSKLYTLGWLIPIIFYEGITKAGRNLNAEKLITAWENIKNLSTNGISGPVSFSSTSHKGIHFTKLYKTDPQANRLVQLTDWRRTPSIKSEI